jgi:hypothetical protein
VRTQALEFLTDQDQLTLNHCRAFSFAHLNGSYEGFILLSLTGIVQQDWHDDRMHLGSLRRFGEDEMKHQQLFRRTETVLGDSCGYPLGRYFDDDQVLVTELTDAILAYPPLPRFPLNSRGSWPLLVRPFPASSLVFTNGGFCRRIGPLAALEG